MLGTVKINLKSKLIEYSRIFSITLTEYLLLPINKQKTCSKAKDFYERLGFKIIQTANFDFGNGYFMNDYVMELTF